MKEITCWKAVVRTEKAGVWRSIWSDKVEYRLGRLTVPPKGCGPLCCLDSFQIAEAFVERESLRPLNFEGLEILLCRALVHEDGGKQGELKWEGSHVTPWREIPDAENTTLCSVVWPQRLVEIKQVEGVCQSTCFWLHHAFCNLYTYPLIEESGECKCCGSCIRAEARRAEARRAEACRAEACRSGDVTIPCQLVDKEKT